jgi:uncharacterized caspase-like protein
MRISLSKCVVCPAAVVALLGLFLAGGCGNLFTGDGGSEGKNWAVVVGISDYQSTALNLKWANEDALDFYDALRQGKGWDSDKITLLTNSSATKAAIKSALAGLSKRVSADDQVVFYFSGRGSYGPDQPPYDEGDGLDEYLVPYDAQLSSVAQDLCDDELETLFSALPTNNVVIILDTGFAGSASRAGVPSSKEKCFVRSGNRAVAARSVDGMSHELARPRYIFISAAQNGMAPVESDQLRNGVFTHYLLEAMRNAQTSGRKGITVQGAFDYAAYRTQVYEGGQTPQMIERRGKKFGLLFF